MKQLAKCSDLSFALLRIVSGAAFSLHGFQKVFGLLGGNQPPMGSQLWIGGLIELVAGLLIAAGFLTRYAAFLASGTMAVAYIQFHWQFQFGQAFFPVVNGGEMALIYCFLFLFIACRGAVTLGLDKKD